MKLLVSAIAALVLSAASLPATAAFKPAALLGEPVQAPTTERAIMAALANRTIAVDAKTRWVNVQHFEVVRFVSNGREFTWYFDGVAQSIDLAELAPADFVDHRVTVYVSNAWDF